MERLTERNKQGYVTTCFWETNTENGMYDLDEKAAEDMIDRLAAYEDTGIEPEEVTALKKAIMGREIAKITEFDGIPIRRLQELAQAEKDGRLVVLLECVPGDPPLKKREMRTEGATSYCPKNCPNKDCVGGQCLVNHGTKPRRR